MFKILIYSIKFFFIICVGFTWNILFIEILDYQSISNLLLNFFNTKYLLLIFFTIPTDLFV